MYIQPDINYFIRIASSRGGAGVMHTQRGSRASARHKCWWKWLERGVMDKYSSLPLTSNRVTSSLQLQSSLSSWWSSPDVRELQRFISWLAIRLPCIDWGQVFAPFARSNVWTCSPQARVRTHWGQVEQGFGLGLVFTQRTSGVSHIDIISLVSAGDHAPLSVHWRSCNPVLSGMWPAPKIQRNLFEENQAAAVNISDGCKWQ